MCICKCVQLSITLYTFQRPFSPKHKCFQPPEEQKFVGFVFKIRNMCWHVVTRPEEVVYRLSWKMCDDSMFDYDYCTFSLCALVLICFFLYLEKACCLVKEEVFFRMNACNR